MITHEIVGEKFAKFRTVTKKVNLIKCDMCENKINDGELYLSISIGNGIIPTDICKNCINKYMDRYIDEELAEETIVISKCKANYDKTSDSIDWIESIDKNEV